MKKLNGTDYTMTEIIELLQNEQITINLDITRLGNENKPAIPLTSLNMRDELEARDIIYLLMADKGGYDIMHWVADYLVLLGKHQSELLDAPQVERSMEKASRFVKAAANRMLYDSNKKLEDIKDEKEACGLIIYDAPKPDREIQSLKNCARCGGNHENLPVYLLKNHDIYTHYAICPTNKQPILTKVLPAGRQLYESDNTTAMNCKHCGRAKWEHENYKKQLLCI